jgi:hypothetical protein
MAQKRLPHEKVGLIKSVTAIARHVMPILLIKKGDELPPTMKNKIALQQVKQSKY